jgi:hypothetical protein
MQLYFIFPIVCRVLGILDKSGDFINFFRIQTRRLMIDELLVFQDSGILLLQKRFSEFRMDTQEDLVTGFFSAMFHYFSGQFGALKCIKTENKLILVRKIADMYIV